MGLKVINKHQSVSIDAWQLEEFFEEISEKCSYHDVADIKMALDDIVNKLITNSKADVCIGEIKPLYILLTELKLLFMSMDIKKQQ